MKAIFSFLRNNTSPNNVIYDNYIKFTALSNHFAKKQGFETVFWGDEFSLRDFKKIKFDHFERLNTNLIKDLPECFWSASKLLSILSMKEPCLHIDNDLYLTKPIDKQFLKNDIICFHSEKFVDHNFEILQDLFKIQPEETKGFPTKSYNCGIIGGQDLTTIKNSINILFDFLSYHGRLIDLIYFKNVREPRYKGFFYPAVLMEQVWLFQLFKFHNKNISTLLNIEDWFDSFARHTQESGYIHLMSEKNRFLPTINKILDTKNISY
jgi:hypothetical protein